MALSRSRRRIHVWLSAAALAAGSVGAPLARAQDCGVHLNELLIDPPGSDDGQEFVELAGTPGLALDGYRLLVIDGDGALAGVVSNVIALDGTALGANGLLLLRDSSAPLAPSPDAETTVLVTDFVPDLENGSSTFVLGFGAAPPAGADLDLDDDGVLDAGALVGFAVADAIGVLESDAAPNFGYAEELGFEDFGPFLGTEPAAHDVAGIFRITEDDCPCGVAGGAVVGAPGGPYQYDFAGGKTFGFPKKTLPPVQKNPGKKNQVAGVKCPRDEIIVFDGGDAYGRFAEGYARQRMGLLEATGALKLQPNGQPVPLQSADGKIKGFDMGAGDTLVDALKELKAKGGTVSLITHGCPGAINVEGSFHAGFDGGTGKPNCVPKILAPFALPGIGKLTDVKLNVVSCHGKRTGGQVTQSVAASMKKEIENQGGSVATLVASNVTTWAVFDKAEYAFNVNFNLAQLFAFYVRLERTNFDNVPLLQHFATVDAAVKAIGGPAAALTRLRYKVLVPGAAAGGGDVTLKSLTSLGALASGVCGGYGHGCAGTGDAVPALYADGCAFSGNPIEIRIEEALGSSAALFFVGVAPTFAPVASGCILLVQPLTTLGPLPLGPGSAGQGTLALPVLLPPAPPLVQIYLQAFVIDPGVSTQFSSTNGLALEIN